MLLDPIFQFRFRNVVSFDVGYDEVLVRQRLDVGDGLEFQHELTEVELHQGATLVAAFLGVGEAEKDLGY